MDQIVISTASVMPMLIAFVLGILLGGVLFHSKAYQKGYERANQDQRRERDARSFADAIQQMMAQGGPHEPTRPDQE